MLFTAGNKKIYSRDLQICMFTFNFLGRWYEFLSTLEIATESVLESVRFVNRDVISTTISQIKTIFIWFLKKISLVRGRDCYLCPETF